MATGFQMTKLGLDKWSDPAGLESLLTILRGRVPEDVLVRVKKGHGDDFGPLLPRKQAFDRVRVYFLKNGVGGRVVIAPENGKGPWAIRSVDYDPTPDSLLTGTESVDAIAREVYAHFHEKYGIVNLGICADKPGQHGKCNAWDIGVSKPKTADAIHAALLDIAQFLRNRMLADLKGEPGLPVLGVIVMEQWCSRESNAWSAYHGVPHVSHVHVSGYPSMYPGWI